MEHQLSSSCPSISGQLLLQMTDEYILPWRHAAHAQVFNFFFAKIFFCTKIFFVKFFFWGVCVKGKGQNLKIVQSMKHFLHFRIV
jgi:hypothetical protein